MLQNYFKTAWRNLLRHKAYTVAINISGLADRDSCVALLIF